MTYILIIPYFFIVLLILNISIRSKKTIKEKTLKAIIILFLSILPIWGDEIIGQTYFSYLCKTDAGTKVYQSYKLEPTYWGVNGEPKFLDDGFFQEDVLNNRFSIVSEKNRNFKPKLNIEKYEEIIIENSNNKELATTVKYIYFGGWATVNSGFYNKGVVCPAEYGLFKPMIKKVFIKQ